LDQPNSGPETPDITYGDDPVVFPTHSHSAHLPGQPLHAPDRQGPSQEKGWYIPTRRRRKWKAYLRQFCRAGADRHIELVIAASVLFFVVLQFNMARNNNKSTSDQVDKIIKAANGINLSAGSFSQSASDIKIYASQFSRSAAEIGIGIDNAVTRLQDQANQVKRSANAANSSATTAKEALHVSERGSLTFGNPTFQSKKPIVLSLQIINDGHIDATNAITTIIEETVSLTDHKKTEGHWSRLRTGDVPPAGSGIEITMTTGAPKIDTAEIGAGKQRVFILGAVTYNDGFADMGDQTALFCYEGVPSFDGKDVRFVFCDAATMIPIAKKEIDYPNSYEEPSLYQ
jgi:hypothetical protein